MNADITLSITETAFAADVSPKVVQHALARKSIRRTKKGREAPLPAAAAFALAVWTGLSARLQPSSSR